MIKKIVQKIILKSFFEIELSSVERNIAIDAINSKYVKSIRSSLIIVLLAIPAILLLDTDIIISVLIPITMVSGTSWFAISLSAVRKKFENFGVELTTNMLQSFVSSLLILFILGFYSLNTELFQSLEFIKEIPIAKAIAGILGSLAIGKIIFEIFVGSIKYDINDAMLTGQSEVAEKFFKKSLSYLYQSAETLKSGKHLEVANYHIGNSFFELFSFIDTRLKSQKLNNGKLNAMIEASLKIKNNPAAAQNEIDKMSIEMIEKFMEYCVIIDDKEMQKNYHNIEEELKCLKNNKESQEMVDTRFATIFEAIAELLENQGESLFDHGIKKKFNK